MTTKIKNIIFDLGGVILGIDEQLTINELKKTGFSDMELLQSPEVFNLLCNFDSGIYTAKTFRKKLKAALNISKMTDEKFDSIWTAMLLDISRETIEAIEKVKKHYKIFLGSNADEIHYDLYVRDLQLRFGYQEFDELFNKAYFSFDIHLIKPDPRFFEFILDHEGLNPEETLFIDDTAENIEAAKRLGIKTYHIRRDEPVKDLFNNGILKNDIAIE